LYHTKIYPEVATIISRATKCLYFLETKNILCMKEEVEKKIVIPLFVHFISA
jgi:hypothetical protein